MASHNDLPDVPVKPEPIPFEWEKLNSYTYRAKVIGGWVLNTNGEALVFIPDRNHEWRIA